MNFIIDTLHSKLIRIGLKRSVVVLSVLLAYFVINGCAAFKPRPEPHPEILNSDSYQQVDHGSQGILIFSLPWQPSIKCVPPYVEGVKIHRIHFIKIPTDDIYKDSDIIAQSNQSLYGEKKIHAIAIDAGKYALSKVEILDSITGNTSNRYKNISMNQDKLFHNQNPNEPIAQFEIQPNEILYIGNIEAFCLSQPPKFKRTFIRLSEIPDFLEEGKDNYPFIQWEKTKYRLLEVPEEFGESYSTECPNDECFAIEDD